MNAASSEARNATAAGDLVRLADSSERHGALERLDELRIVRGDVERRNLRALVGEPLRDRSPDATTRAGHQRYLVFQPAHVDPRRSPTTATASVMIGSTAGKHVGRRLAM